MTQPTNRTAPESTESPTTAVSAATADPAELKTNKAALALFAILYAAMTAYLSMVCIQILSDNG
jgi:hypothetical protein